MTEMIRRVILQTNDSRAGVEIPPHVYLSNSVIVFVMFRGICSELLCYTIPTHRSL